ncbi:hypothetical protein ACODNH_19885 (plasmid) [Haloarcula sp. NS06]|uniref:hypothetical protein n=1 Tax=Haloarcula sp. NS06 TaxID=3409688 RepID=UPI003DA745B2
MEKILENQGLDESLQNHDPSTRRLNKKVRELRKEDYLSEESKDQIIHDAKQTLKQARRQLNGGRESGSTDKNSDSGFKASLPVIGDTSGGGITDLSGPPKSFEKPSAIQVALVLGVLLAGIILGGGIVVAFGSSTPFVPTDGSATITSPETGKLSRVVNSLLLERRTPLV